MKKYKKFFSLVLSLAVILSIGCSGYVKADASEHDDALCCEEVGLQGVARMSCTACPAGDITYLRCTGAQAYSHTDDHETGFLGVGGETCTRVWNRSTIQYVCMSCSNVVESDFGHYCKIYHSICDTESWCPAGAIA